METIITPWLDRAEFDAVASWIASRQLDLIKRASRRIHIWHNRLTRPPLAMEVTCSVLDAFIHYHDSEEIYRDATQPAFLAALVRFVHLIGTVGEKLGMTKLYDIAARLGLPRVVVDLRHDTVHGQSPKLMPLFAAMVVVLQWLIDRYWTEPDSMAPNGVIDLSCERSVRYNDRLARLISARMTAVQLRNAGLHWITFDDKSLDVKRISKTERRRRRQFCGSEKRRLIKEVLATIDQELLDAPQASVTARIVSYMMYAGIDDVRSADNLGLGTLVDIHCESILHRLVTDISVNGGTDLKLSWLDFILSRSALHRIGCEAWTDIYSKWLLSSMILAPDVREMFRVQFRRLLDDRLDETVDATLTGIESCTYDAHRKEDWQQDNAWTSRPLGHLEGQLVWESDLDCGSGDIVDIFVSGSEATDAAVRDHLGQYFRLRY